MTHCLLKPSATARGTFWSRRTASRSATPDDLLLVDHPAGIVERADYVLPHQLRIGLQDPLDGVSTSNHAEDVLQHDARPANSRLAAANRRIHTDSVFHLRRLLPLVPVSIYPVSTLVIKSFSDAFIMCPSPCPLPRGEGCGR